MHKMGLIKKAKKVVALIMYLLKEAKKMISEELLWNSNMTQREPRTHNEDATPLVKCLVGPKTCSKCRRCWIIATLKTRH